jgi:hypothetical protein
MSSYYGQNNFNGYLNFYYNSYNGYYGNVGYNNYGGQGSWGLYLGLQFNN